ncbi:MAG: alpha/beta fold hydrolase [Phycisphaerales bacterium]|nr:alpha/beta fold hydrolase [Phycisphaerales bacterium]
MSELRDKSGCRATVNNLAAVFALLLVVLVGVGSVLAQDAPPPAAPPSAAPSSPVEQPFESTPPSVSVRPHVARDWKSAGGLRCQWSIPTGLRKGQTRDLIVILHGTGLDYRWGLANHEPVVFRPDDFLLSPDGTSPGIEGSRLFLGRDQDADAFAALLREVTALLPVRRIFLYGHSQGGFFATYFAGQHPELVDGVVAHGSGAWNWTNIDALHGIPIVFMHGTADPVVPYAQSTGSRRVFAELGHQKVQVRLLPGFGHGPNGVRTSECIDWCIGMATGDPAEALDKARAILRPKPGDQYGYECPAWFSGGSDLLARIIGRHAESFTPAAPDLPHLRELARPLLDALEAHAALHVAALRRYVRTRDDLKLTGAPWLGHLMAFREDFRGVRPAEEYIKAIGYDAAAADHRRAALELTQTWYRRVGGRQTFETIVRVLPHCFLSDSLPAEMAEQVPAWFRDAAALNLSPESIRDYRYFLMYEAARDPAPYRTLWSRWSLP